MQDLRAQLLSLGLVTPKQVEESKPVKRKPKGVIPQKKPVLVDDFAQKQRLKQIDMLRSLPNKNEQYALIRRWVERNRLDPEILPTGAETERFFFEKIDGNVTWLTLEVSLCNLLKEGQAAVMTYMSNHGLSHCVVPTDIAEDVALVFPLWLRVLKGHPLAGQKQVKEDKEDKQGQAVEVRDEPGN